MKTVYWSIVFCVILMHIIPLYARYRNKYYLNRKYGTSDETKQMLTRVLNKLFNVDLKNSRDNYGISAINLIVVEIDPSEFGVSEGSASSEFFKNQVSNEENTASEILDDLRGFNEDNNQKSVGFRRRSSKKKYRDRKKRDSSSSSSTDSSSSSSELEKNEGNPFTIHKNTYKQNWLWNHEMDGDHMNINPFAPQLNTAGPTGADLFFARKWWYFNQDDYKPMGRRR